MLKRSTDLVLNKKTKKYHSHINTLYKQISKNIVDKVNIFVVVIKHIYFNICLENSKSKQTNNSIYDLLLLSLELKFEN